MNLPGTPTRWYSTITPLERERALDKGARLLLEGGLVAFPTETVYGLGAHTFNPQALKKIFQVKGRPPDNPLIIHVARSSELIRVAEKVPPEAYLLAEYFWPGPLTLVLQKRKDVPTEVSCGLPTVAIRIPSQPLARELLHRINAPVSAPSANLSGRPSPTRAEHVWDDLAGKIDAIIDGGDASVGLESSVLDLNSSPPVLLRPGGITREQLEECLGKKITVTEQSASSSPSSPGMKYRHYSPQAPLYLLVGTLEKIEQKMKELLMEIENRNITAGLLCSQENKVGLYFDGVLIEKLGSREDPGYMAASLYNSLRRLDERGAGIILAEGIEERGMGLALMNRLKKAATEVIRVS